MKNFMNGLDISSPNRQHHMLVNFSNTGDKKLLGVLWHHNQRAYFAQGDKQAIWDEVSRWLEHTKPENTISGVEILEEAALTVI